MASLVTLQWSLIVLGASGRALTTYRFTEVKVIFCYFYQIWHIQDLREDVPEPSQKFLIAHCEALYIYLM